MVVGHEQLAVEVVGPQIASVSEDQSPDSGGRQFKGHHAPETTHAGHQHRSPFETALGQLTKAAHGKLPAVGLHLVGGQLRQAVGAR